MFVYINRFVLYDISASDAANTSNIQNCGLIFNFTFIHYPRICSSVCLSLVIVVWSHRVCYLSRTEFVVRINVLDKQPRNCFNLSDEVPRTRSRDRRFQSSNAYLCLASLFTVYVLSLQGVSHEWPPIVLLDLRDRRQNVLWVKRIYDSFSLEFFVFSLSSLDVSNKQRIRLPDDPFGSAWNRLNFGGQVVARSVALLYDQFFGRRALNIMHLKTRLPLKLSRRSLVWTLLFLFVTQSGQIHSALCNS